MAKKMEFGSNLKEALVKPEKLEKANTSTNAGGFSLDRINTKKEKRESFLVYMEKDKLKRIDKLASQTGESRNALINRMLDYTLESIKK